MSLCLRALCVLLVAVWWSGSAQASERKVIAIVLDDSSSMSVDDSKLGSTAPGSDPEGYAVKGAAELVQHLPDGTLIGYFPLNYYKKSSDPKKMTGPLLQLEANAALWEENFKKVRDAFLVRNVAHAREQDGWGSETPHPYWGLTPCLPALKAAKRWLEKQGGAGAQEEIRFWTDGECMDNFQYETVKKIVGAVELNCLGVGKSFCARGGAPKAFRNTCNALGSYKCESDPERIPQAASEPRDCADHTGVFQEIRRQTKAFQGKYTQARWVTCSEVSQKAGGDALKWSWPAAKQFRGRKYAAVDKSKSPEVSWVKVIKEEARERQSSGCEHQIENGTVKGHFQLRARLDVQEGTCKNELSGDIKGDTVGANVACLKGYLEVDLHDNSRAKATLDTLHAYTGDAFNVSVSDSFGIDEKIWTYVHDDKSGEVFWTRTVDLKAGKKETYTFELNSDKLEKMQCKGPIGSASRSLTYRKSANCRLERDEPCEFPSVAKGKGIDLAFGVVDPSTSSVDRICHYRLECEGNTGKDVQYSLENVVAGRGLNTESECFLFEHSTLTFKPGSKKAQKLRFSMRWRGGENKSACERAIEDGGGDVSYEESFRLRHGTDELRFTATAAYKEGVKVIPDKDPPFVYRPDPWAFKVTDADSDVLEVKFRFEGKGKEESAVLDLSPESGDVTVHVLHADGKYQDLEELLKKGVDPKKEAGGFERGTPWWRYNRGDPEQEPPYKWVECDPKNGVYPALVELTVPAKQEKTVCFRLTRRIDRCANAGLFRFKCNGLAEKLKLVFFVEAYRKKTADEVGEPITVETAKQKEDAKAKPALAEHATLHIPRTWKDYVLAGPGLWWAWLLNPFFGFVMVLWGLWRTRTRSLWPLRRGTVFLWSLWLLGTAVTVYFKIAS